MFINDLNNTNTEMTKNTVENTVENTAEEVVATKAPLKWIRRFSVQKEEGHIAYFDLYEDIYTHAQYFGTRDNLIPRAGIIGDRVVLD